MFLLFFFASFTPPLFRWTVLDDLLVSTTEWSDEWFKSEATTTFRGSIDVQLIEVVIVNRNIHNSLSFFFLLVMPLAKSDATVTNPFYFSTNYRDKNEHTYQSILVAALSDKSALLFHLVKTPRLIGLSSLFCCFLSPMRGHTGLDR